MVEFASAALGSLASSIGSALGVGSAAVGAPLNLAATAFSTLPAASAAGGTLSSLFSAGSLASVVSGGAGLASAFASIRQGQAEAAGLNEKALDVGQDILAERVQGNERQNTLRRGLLEALAERDVATAASGLDLSFGTAREARRAAVEDGERALGIDQGTTDFRVSRLRQRADLLRLQGGEARRGSLARAAGQLLETGASVLRRG